MRAFLAYIFLVLALLSSAAYLWAPKVVDDGRTPLIWTTDDNPQRVPQVDGFNQQYPHLHLRTDPDNADAMKVMVQSSAGMGPDIIGRIYLSNIQMYHEAGILMDLTDHADAMGFGLDTLHESIHDLMTLPVLMEDGSIQQRMFSYPFSFGQKIVFYNKNVFDRAGVPYPPDDLTWETFIELAQKLTVRDEQRGLPEVFGAGGVCVTSLLFSFGAEFLNEHGTRSTMDSPEFIDAMVFYHRLLYDLQVEPSPIERAGIASQGGWGGGFNNWFGEGRLAMYSGASWMLISFRRFLAEQTRAREAWLAAHPDADPSEAPEVLRIGAVQVPRFQDRERRLLIWARSAGINVASPNRKEALSFLQYLAGDTYNRTIAEGADNLPPNVQFHTLEKLVHPDWPGEEEVHAASVAAIPFGQIPRRSMLINTGSVNHEFSLVTSNIQASPELTPEMIAVELRRASDRVNLLIARNIKRNPRVRQMYEALLAQGAEPIVYNLEEVR